MTPACDDPFSPPFTSELPVMLMSSGVPAADPPHPSPRRQASP